MKPLRAAYEYEFNINKDVKYSLYRLAYIPQIKGMLDIIYEMYLMQSKIDQ
jgi:hypothetical protein